MSNDQWFRSRKHGPYLRLETSFKLLPIFVPYRLVCEGLYFLFEGSVSRNFHSCFILYFMKKNGLLNNKILNNIK